MQGDCCKCLRAECVSCSVIRFTLHISCRLVRVTEAHLSQTYYQILKKLILLVGHRNYYYYYYYDDDERSAMQDCEGAIYTLSVQRPQPHNTNLY